MSGAGVFVAGSLHFDVVVNAPRLPRLDETVTGHGVELVCGGKGCNQAVAAARHGAPTAMAGCVGDDLFGERLLAHLDGAGVERSAIQVRRGGASGLSVAIVDGHGDYGAVIVSAANLELDAGVIEIPAATRVVLLQNEIAPQANLALARKARAAGAWVVLNGAPWRELPAALLETLDLLVVNRVEAAAMAGRADLSPAAAGAVLGALPAAPEVIVTFGAGGVLHRDASGNLHEQPAFAVDAVSSHGAGDVFVGALASRLAATQPMAAALRYAAAAAALHVAAPVAERLSISPAQVGIFMASARRHG